MVKNPLLSQLIAGFGLFVGTLVVLTIITGIVARSVRSSALSPIDRTLGFIFGLVRGAFIVSLAYLLLDVSVQAPERPAWLRDAKSAPYLHQGAEYLRNILPESLKLKSAAAAEETIQRFNAAEEAQKAIRAYVNPTAPPPPAPDQPQAPKYDRQQFDRLIGNQR
jgi:membrane protein required for colicin V production